MQINYSRTNPTANLLHADTRRECMRINDVIRKFPVPRDGRPLTDKDIFYGDNLATKKAHKLAPAIRGYEIDSIESDLLISKEVRGDRHLTTLAQAIALVATREIPYSAPRSTKEQESNLDVGFARLISGALYEAGVTLPEDLAKALPFRDPDFMWPAHLAAQDLVANVEVACATGHLDQLGRSYNYATHRPTDDYILAMS